VKTSLVVGLGRSARLGLFARPTAADAGAVERAIAEQELGPLGDRRVDALSGGERQRVVLAMALAQEASVLLLDEPTAHLDPSHQRGVLLRVGELARTRGVIALAVLHDLNLAARAARVVVIDGGVIVADGPPATALAVNMHLVWTGIARTLRDRGDSSLEFVLTEAASGEVFAFAISEAGNDLVLFGSTTDARPLPGGGYAFTGTKIFTSLSPVWTRLGLFGLDTVSDDAPKLVHAFVTRAAPGRLRTYWRRCANRRRS